MDILSARKWIIVSSFIISSATFLFLVVAPAFDFPLMYDQSWRLLQIIFPVFLGYLASAAHFVFSTAREPQDEEVNRAQRLGQHAELAALLIRWPVLIFGVLVIAAIGVFGYTNR